MTETAQFRKDSQRLLLGFQGQLINYSQRPSLYHTSTFFLFAFWFISLVFTDILINKKMWFMPEEIKLHSKRNRNFKINK